MASYIETNPPTQVQNPDQHPDNSPGNPLAKIILSAGGIGLTIAALRELIVHRYFPGLIDHNPPPGLVDSFLATDAHGHMSDPPAIPTLEGIAAHQVNPYTQEGFSPAPTPLPQTGFESPPIPQFTEQLLPPPDELFDRYVTMATHHGLPLKDPEFETDPTLYDFDAPILPQEAYEIAVRVASSDFTDITLDDQGNDLNASFRVACDSLQVASETGQNLEAARAYWKAVVTEMLGQIDFMAKGDPTVKARFMSEFDTKMSAIEIANHLYDISQGQIILDYPDKYLQYLEDLTQVADALDSGVGVSQAMENYWANWEQILNPQDSQSSLPFDISPVAQAKIDDLKKGLAQIS